ncbi:MAG: hypothetical protein HC822_22165, partial [Oscillochloris sp.]|nr:hypothetical protein [Oscillochloris sp.]
MAQENATDLVAALLERLTAEQGRLPESIAMVLWGIDNLKSDGEGVAQVLALLGARVQLDELGTVSGVELIPLDVLGRPRIDVVVTVSGIFRDLLHHQDDPDRQSGPPRCHRRRASRAKLCAQARPSA